MTETSFNILFRGLLLDSFTLPLSVGDTVYTAKLLISERFHESVHAIVIILPNATDISIPYMDYFPPRYFEELDSFVFTEDYLTKLAAIQNTDSDFCIEFHFIPPEELSTSFSYADLTGDSSNSPYINQSTSSHPIAADDAVVSYCHSLLFPMSSKQIPQSGQNKQTTQQKSRKKQPITEPSLILIPSYSGHFRSTKKIRQLFKISSKPNLTPHTVDIFLHEMQCVYVRTCYQAISHKILESQRKLINDRTLRYSLLSFSSSSSSAPSPHHSSSLFIPGGLLLVGGRGVSGRSTFLFYFLRYLLLNLPTDVSLSIVLFSQTVS